jgi:hypothetical protein
VEFKTWGFQQWQNHWIHCRLQGNHHIKATSRKKRVGPKIFRSVWNISLQFSLTTYDGDLYLISGLHSHCFLFTDTELDCNLLKNFNSYTYQTRR